MTGKRLGSKALVFEARNWCLSVSVRLLTSALSAWSAMLFSLVMPTGMHS